MEDTVLDFWNTLRHLNVDLEYLTWQDDTLGMLTPSLSVYHVNSSVGPITMGFAGPVLPVWVDVLAMHFAQRIHYDASSVMVSTAIHEIRNPFTVLAGYIELLAREQPHPLLQKIDDLMWRITGQLEDVMAGFVEGYPHEAFDLMGLVQQVGDDYAAMLARLLRQVLRNLIHNGADAIGEHGQITVSVQQDGHVLTIAVRDDGQGINNDIRPFLFQPYYTSKIEGHGLGLAFCKRVVESHHGSIQVKDLSPGTEFVITLVVHDAP
ncbi:MAG: HAMP domain-containing sensor histidine kinase [Sulfobacillus thermotolerans]|nr:HAMP domain-containing sensor histidine kinase [Sulfobacillus thermotolerans]